MRTPPSHPAVAAGAGAKQHARNTEYGKSTAVFKRLAEEQAMGGHKAIAAKAKAAAGDKPALAAAFLKL